MSRREYEKLDNSGKIHYKGKNYEYNNSPDDC